MDYNQLRSDKEVIKMCEASRVDWRAELSEEHPYVEVCPKQDGEEDKKKAKKEDKKEDKEEEVKEAAAVAALPLIKGAAKLAATDVAISGIKDIGSRAKEELHKLIDPDEKDKKKAVKEERKDEAGLSPDEKSIGRSLRADLDPINNHMAAAIRQRLNLGARGKKKRRGMKEETVLEDRVEQTPEEKQTSLKWKERHDAQYARGAKERRGAKKSPLKKGEVRKFNSETGKWESNLD